MSASASVICTEKIAKRYGDLLALDDINVQVDRGEIYGFLGHNGAGKTTLMSILLGLIPPTSGTVYLFGEPFTKRRPEIIARIGVMGEEQHFYEDMTAFEYLTLFADLTGVHAKKKVIEDRLEAVGLLERQLYLIETFSHGMRQKLGLARALLHEPELLFLDEPVSGLDPHGIRSVRELLLELKQRGTTVFISSHVLSEVERVADRVGILVKGRLLAEGTLKRLGELVGKKTILEIEYSATRNGIGEMLRQMPFIFDLHEGHHRLVIEMDASEDYRHQISKAITELGGVIIAMKMREPTLEETFVTLTERNLTNLVDLVNT